jgi:polyisoprenoid-binding protein YceI
MAASERMTAPGLRALLKGGVLSGEWELDSRRSSIRLKHRSLGGLVRVNGVFGEVGGSGTVSAEGEASGSVTVAAASINTKNKRRDKHLRSAAFLDSDNYPQITFTVDHLQVSGSVATVIGELTVHGRTRPTSFDAAVPAPLDGEIWLDAEVDINRADFGLTWNSMGLLSMNNVLTIHTVFVRG